MNDFGHCAALWADPRVVEHITGRPLSREEAWLRFVRYPGHWSLLNFGFWLAEEKATGRFVGELGFATFHRDLDPPLEDIPEAGWVLAADAHGKGYATEAVQAMLAWGEQNLPVRRTLCIISPENAASIRVARKCGYQEQRRAVYKGHPIIVFVRP